jgi:hypothetical protein
VDRKPVDSALLAQAKAVCEAEAMAAAARYSSLQSDPSILQAFAQFNTNPSAYTNPNIQGGFNNIGTTLRENRAEEMRSAVQLGVFVSTMKGCMAHHGYIAQE